MPCGRWPGRRPSYWPENCSARSGVAELPLLGQGQKSCTPGEPGAYFGLAPAIEAAAGEEFNKSFKDMDGWSADLQLMIAKKLYPVLT